MDHKQAVLQLKSGERWSTTRTSPTLRSIQHTECGLRNMIKTLPLSILTELSICLTSWERWLMQQA